MISKLLIAHPFITITSRNSTEKYTEEEMGKMDNKEAVKKNRVCSTGQTMAGRGCNACLHVFEMYKHLGGIGFV